MLEHVERARWPSCRADRLASAIRLDEPGDCVVALLGLPHDVGVRLNGGRAGAADGPRAFRAAFAATIGTHDAAESRGMRPILFDAGDVVPAAGEDESALLETHSRVEAAVHALQARGLITLCVGGGHDLALPSIRALSRIQGGPVGGMNVDPHLDVRESVGSGMPFRSAIECGALDAERFVEYGTSRFSNSAEHVGWVTGRRATIIPMDKALEHRAAQNLAFERISRGPSERAFVSFDLDAMDSAHAPGVSAPCPMGLRPEDGVRLMRRAGSMECVRHVDLMELCPAQDDGVVGAEGARHGRTARLAALLAAVFLSEVEARTR